MIKAPFVKPYTILYKYLKLQLKRPLKPVELIEDLPGPQKHAE